MTTESEINYLNFYYENILTQHSTKYLESLELNISTSALLMNSDIEPDLNVNLINKKHPSLIINQLSLARVSKINVFNQIKFNIFSKIHFSSFFNYIFHFAATCFFRILCLLT